MIVVSICCTSGCNRLNLNTSYANRSLARPCLKALGSIYLLWAFEKISLVDKSEVKSSKTYNYRKIQEHDFRIQKRAAVANSEEMSSQIL